MGRQIILGMGAGQCGTMLLAQILDKQPNAAVTHEQPPLLPWKIEPGVPGVRERLQRILDTRPHHFIGDVATFYLPYVEQAIEFDAEIRIVCLQRPRQEIIAGLCRSLDQSSPFLINHWAEEPAPGWYHDPIWSRIFPKYDTQDRVEGIGRYWDEYYARAEELARRYPNNVRIWDTEVLTSEAGVREVLSFAGMPHGDQVIILGQRPTGVNDVEPQQQSRRPRYPHPLDPRKCVILVPFTGFIHQECDDALKELERRGYAVRRVGGYAAIDQGRNQMATDALLDGFEETLWIDSDVAFHPDAVDHLRAHPHPIVCAIYPQKGKRALACHIMPGTPTMAFGKRGGLIELLYAGTGFLLIRREVYLTLQRKLNLPVCNERFGHPTIPFFLPMVRQIEEGYWYLAEDYAFCHRARQCGFKIYGDTSIRLWHIGYYRYGWEDAGLDRQRYGTFTLNFGDAPGRARETETERHPSLTNFALQYPWPAEKPLVPRFEGGDGVPSGTQDFLTRHVPPMARMVVELGSWTGRITRLLAGLAPHASVIAVDSWYREPRDENSTEMPTLPPRLHDLFLSECWNYRDQIIPLRSDPVEGLQRIGEAGLNADAVYINADGEDEKVAKQLAAVLDLFPGAVVLGSGVERPGTRTALETIRRERGVAYEACNSNWRILRSGQKSEEGRQAGTR